MESQPRGSYLSMRSEGLTKVAWKARSASRNASPSPGTIFEGRGSVACMSVQPLRGVWVRMPGLRWSEVDVLLPALPSLGASPGGSSCSVFPGGLDLLET